MSISIKPKERTKLNNVATLDETHIPQYNIHNENNYYLVKELDGMVLKHSK